MSSSSSSSIKNILTPQGGWGQFFFYVPFYIAGVWVADSTATAVNNKFHFFDTKQIGLFNTK
jgi:hypothetical protein